MAKNALVPEVEALGAILTALTGLDDAVKKWVLQTAADRFQVPLAQEGQGGVRGASTPAARPAVALGDNPSPKEFMKAKAPQNDVQRAACLAFFLTNYRDTQHFKSIDLTRLNTDAAGPKINMPRAVDNAVARNHYLAVAGAGKKQITSHGEDVVNALPDQDAVKEVEAKAVKKTKRAAKGRKKAASKA